MAMRTAAAATAALPKARATTAQGGITAEGTTSAAES
jgi:hypothetical protein